MTGRRFCPSCWRPVRRTINDCIEGHWDTAGRVCKEASGEPYFITLSHKPKKEAA